MRGDGTGRGGPRLASKVAEAAAAWCRYNLFAPLRRRPLLPRSLTVIATHRCNARCIMCGIWRERGAGGDLTLGEYGRLLDDPLFPRLEYVGLNGGEPFIRDDIAEIAALFLRRRRLRRLSVVTNGLLPERVIAGAGEMAREAARRGTLLDVVLSLHGIDEALDRVFGVDGAFDRVRRSLDHLLSLRSRGLLTVAFNCVLLPENIHEAPAIRRWAASAGVPVNFAVGEERERFRNAGFRGLLDDPDRRGELAALFRDLKRMERPGSFGSLRYEELSRMAGNGKGRTLSCHLWFSGPMLGHDGALHYCCRSAPLGNVRETTAHRLYYAPESLARRREEIRGRLCRSCPPYTRTSLEVATDAHLHAAHFVRERLGLHG